MNGNIILNTPIAVDVWKRGTDKYVHFLSHCHTDHMVGLCSSWRLPIYTTHFSAWMLENKYKVKSNLLRPLSIGDNHIVGVPETGEEFTVTLIDANHCPGSVMFLFQGSFGTVLYTGDFRYDPVMLENKMLAYVIKNEVLDVLYVDNTYASPNCKFPSRREATQQAVQIIRDHPEHKILLGLRKLGKEELLSEIALEFCEKIYVSEDRLAILQKLECEDVFTTDPDSCRIHVVNFYSVTPSFMRQRQKKCPHIAVLPTALYKCGLDDQKCPYKNSADHGIYVVPYSDHSPFEELFTFISHLKPAKIYPIVKETKQYKNKMLNYGSVEKLSTLTRRICKLPCEKRWKRTNCQNKESATLRDTTKHMALRSQLCCDIRHTKSPCRPQIMQWKKLSKVFQQKGVQFDSSFTSDDGDETLQMRVKHGTELERKYIVLRTPHGKHTRVKVPHNLQENWPDVQVKLINDLDSVKKNCGDRSSRYGCDAVSFTVPSHHSGGSISPCKDIDTGFEEFCSSAAYNSDGNLIQGTSLSCAVHIKQTISAQGNPHDIDQVSFNSPSDVTEPHIKSLSDIVKSDKEFAEKIWPGIMSVEEEGLQKLEVQSDREHGHFSRDKTDNTVQNYMVKIPSDSYADQKLLGRSFHKGRLNNPSRCHCCSRDSGIVSSNAGLLDLDRICTRKKSCTKQKCVSLNIPSLQHPLSFINININATCASKAHGIKSLQTSECSWEPNLQESGTGGLLQFSPVPTLLICSDAQYHKPSKDRIQTTSVESIGTSEWSSEPNMQQSDSQSHEACDDRIQTSDCSNEPNMQQSDTGHLLQFSTTPALLTCSDSQSHKASDDGIQTSSVESIGTSEWSSEPNMQQSDSQSHEACDDRDDRIQTSDCSNEPNMQQSDTGSLLQFSTTPALLTCSDSQSHKASDDRIQTSEWSSKPNMQQSESQSHEASDDREDRIQMSVKSLQTSEWSSEPNMQHSNSQSPKASDNRTQLSGISLQSSNWISESNTQQSDIGSLLQFSHPPTLLTCSDAHSHDKGNEVIRGCHTNSKKGNRIVSSLKTRIRSTCNKETCFHSFEEPERNLSVAQNEQFLNHCPLSLDACNMLQTDGQYKAQIQCKEMLLPQNFATIKASFQQMEVNSTESGGIRSRHSDENEEGTVAKRKQISPEHNFELEKLSDLSVVNKRNCERSNSETIVLMTEITNVAESNNPRKRRKHNSDGQINTATLKSDSMLQNKNNTGIQSMEQAVAGIMTGESYEHGIHNKPVTNTPHYGKESNRTPTDECEAYVQPEMPMSAYQVNCNYWTNGNRVPFAIHEVHQAVHQLLF